MDPSRQTGVIGWLVDAETPVPHLTDHPQVSSQQQCRQSHRDDMLLFVSCKLGLLGTLHCLRSAVGMLHYYINTADAARLHVFFNKVICVSGGGCMAGSLSCLLRELCCDKVYKT